MIDIVPLRSAPFARASCIDWSHAEWGAAANFTLTDWQDEFRRIDASPLDQVFVALEGASPVGMIWLLEHEDVATHMHLTPWLSSLVVAPAHRKRGIAAALVAHIETCATSGGASTLYLLTESPSYYFRLGWAVCDTATVGKERVFVMKKALAQHARPKQNRPTG